MKLLHIDSSPMGTDSVSRHLSAQVVCAWQQSVPALEVSYLDLAADPSAHLTAQLLQVLRPAAGVTPALSQSLRHELDYTEQRIGQFFKRRCAGHRDAYVQVWPTYLA